MVSFLGYLYFYYNTRRPIWLKKNLSLFKVAVLYLWRCSSRESHAQLIALLWAVFGSSRESHAQLIALLWAVFGSSRESHAIVLQIPTTKKSLLGNAQKVIPQKARFSLENREKAIIFRQPTL